MQNIQINELPFKDVRVSKLITFDGLQVDFSINEQSFRFLLGNSGKPVPLSILHTFTKKSQCCFCEKTVYEYPSAQQLCSVLKIYRYELLDYFRTHHNEALLIK